MVTALNHAVADGRRAGGLNLSSSILTDEGEAESEAWKGALLPEATAFQEETVPIAEENQWFESDESHKRGYNAIVTTSFVKKKPACA